MSNHETILAILEAENEAMLAVLEANSDAPHINECSFKLGYLILTLVDIANHHPDVADELHDRLKRIKGRK